MLLARARVTTMLPVVDLDRARRFYEDVLQLAPAGRSGDGKLLFRTAAGNLLYVHENL